MIGSLVKLAERGLLPDALIRMGIRMLDRARIRQESAGGPEAQAQRRTELIEKLRRAHPTWGSRKLKAVLEREHPDLNFPAQSTIAEIIRRAGLVKPRRSRRRRRATPTKLTDSHAPNHIWCADFKDEENMARPHEALQMQMPLEVHTTSCKRFPDPLPHPEYPLHDLTKTVYKDGHICLGKKKTYNIGAALACQQIGLREVRERLRLTSFMDKKLGYLDDHRRKVVHEVPALTPPRANK